LTWQDLQVGDVLRIYGRVIQINGCDPFTRDFYKSQGMEQEPDDLPEEDAFMRSRAWWGIYECARHRHGGGCRWGWRMAFFLTIGKISNTMPA